MRLSKALNDKVMDVRLRDKLIADGSLSQNDVEKYLTALSDDTNNLQYTSDAETSNNSEEEAATTEQ